MPTLHPFLFRLPQRLAGLPKEATTLQACLLLGSYGLCGWGAAKLANALAPHSPLLQVLPFSRAALHTVDNAEWRGLLVGSCRGWQFA